MEHNNLKNETGSAENYMAKVKGRSRKIIKQEPSNYERKYAAITNALKSSERCSHRMQPIKKLQQGKSNEIISKKENESKQIQPKRNINRKIDASLKTTTEVTKALKRTFMIEIENKNDKIDVHPDFASITNNDPAPLEDEERKVGVHKNNAIEIIDSDEEEVMEQQVGGTMRGLMNLVALTSDDLETLQQGRLVNDACIDALADVLQRTINTNEASICHTGFWAAVREHGWGNDAKKLVHPDPNEAGMETWQAYRFTRGHLNSKLLMIPCNFPGESEAEVGHWILVIRERGENGKHKLHILDSLGKKSGREHRDEIVNKLAGTPVFSNFPKGKTFDVEKQYEFECGARVAKYMEDIIQNYLSMSTRDNITKMIGTTIRREKNQGKREVTRCRNQIKDRLEGEQRNLLSSNQHA
jgi:hypothetical protein